MHSDSFLSFRHTTQWFNICVCCKMIITVSLLNDISSYKSTNTIQESPSSQRPSLLMPSPWGLGFQHISGRWGTNNQFTAPSKFVPSSCPCCSFCLGYLVLCVQVACSFETFRPYNSHLLETLCSHYRKKTISLTPVLSVLASHLIFFLLPTLFSLLFTYLFIVLCVSTN